MVEGELGQVVRVEQPDLERLVARARLPLGLGRVDDQDDRVAGRRVDADQPAEPRGQAGLLDDLARERGADLLAAVDEPGREAPLAESRARSRAGTSTIRSPIESTAAAATFGSLNSTQPQRGQVGRARWSRGRSTSRVPHCRQCGPLGAASRPAGLAAAAAGWPGAGDGAARRRPGPGLPDSMKWPAGFCSRGTQLIVPPSWARLARAAATSGCRRASLTFQAPLIWLTQSCESDRISTGRRPPARA